MDVGLQRIKQNAKLPIPTEKRTPPATEVTNTGLWAH